MKRAIPHLALALAAIYVILSVAAAVCLFEHAASKPAGHHASHHQKSPQAHSTLCVWACQANPGAILITAAPPIQATLLMLFVLLLSAAAPFKLLSTQLHLRGPPSVA